MKVDPVLLMVLLEEVGRARALSEAESRLLESVIRKEAKPARQTHKWTKANDRTLLRVQHRPRGVADYAKRVGVSEHAAWMRLDRLRKRLRGAGRAETLGG